MRRWLVAAAASAQIAVLAWMAGEREWVLRTGEPILVRTAPIDPRDPMRGDYVRFNYEISLVARTLCRDGLEHCFSAGGGRRRDVRDTRVYARLERGEEGLVSIVSLSDRRPSEGLFVRGRIDYVQGDAIAVRYGIEALFTEQWAARRIEDEARTEKEGVPINAEVMLSPGGLAVMRGVRWEPLGITFALRRAVVPDGQSDGLRLRRAGIEGATITLKNHGDQNVAIVDLPGGASLRLVPLERWSDARYSQVPRPPAPAPRAEDVVMVAPGQAHVVELDLTRPEWHVLRIAGNGARAEEPQSLASLAETWSAWFRFEYAPPSRAACAGLPGADQIRHVPLRSRSFGAGGGMD